MKRILAAIVLTSVVLGLIGMAVLSDRCSGLRRCVFLPAVLRAAQPTATSAPNGQPTTGPSAVPTATSAPSAVPTATLRPDPVLIRGLAVLGDSTQDEYQVDNPRGEEYNPTTFNWVELLVRVRGLNLGEWGQRAEPRRGGYAFNWARSGATSDQMLSAGQHTGARDQVLAGEVSHAVIQIGINDFYFSGLGLAIYEGTIGGGELQARLDQIVEHIITAAQTLQATGRCAVLVAATQDYLTLPVVPELYQTYQDPAGRQRFVDAVAYINSRLAKLSADEGVAYFDFNTAYLAEINRRLDAQGYLIVGGERIDLRTRGNNPRFGLIDDGYIHPGTVLSSLYVNVYVEAFNRSFGTAIAPLSDEEILRVAGITP